MDQAPSEDWRMPSGMMQDQQKTDLSISSNRESWAAGGNNRPGSGNGRRLSDGAPVPFNRTRSFKTKQLVRSQAIRESQSPPRIPSPRPPGSLEPGEKAKILPSVKKKSLSVDLDDRTTSTSDDYQINDKVPIILKKNDTKVINSNVKDNIINSDSKNSGATSKVKSLVDEDVVNASKKTMPTVATSNQIDDDKLNKMMQNVTETVIDTDITKNRYRDNDEEKITVISNNVSANVSNNNNSERSNMNVDNDAVGMDASKNNFDCSKVDVSCNINNNNDSFSLDQATIGRNNALVNQLSNRTHNNNINSRCDSVDTLPGDTKTNGRSPRVALADTKRQSSFGKSQEHDERTDKSPVGRNNCIKVEFQQVEIQVTSGDDTNYSQYRQNSDSIAKARNSKRCDCSSGRSMEFEEYEEQEEDCKSKWGGRRAVCPSKQDSGVCCWEPCSCCGDLSPDLNMSFSDDAEEDSVRPRRQRQISEHDCFHHQSIDCRCCQDKDKWPKKSGSTLTVQRASSGGTPRLLRKQSSGGSMDSGQHSISSPFLSRDNSTELMMLGYEPMDVNRFIKDTLNKSYKDRLMLLKIEHDMISLVRDPSRREQKFSQFSSYGRLLIHRCADLFGLKHGVDSAKQSVFVAKPPLGTPPCRIPAICPFQQWCFVKFPCSPTAFCETTPAAKSILKRDSHSLDEEAAALQPSRPTPRSKSFEQREEEYCRARRRIFSSTGEEQHDAPWDWEEGKENETDGENCKPRLLVPEGDRASRAGRLLKVQSLESRETAPIVRGVVSKAHSFGGYGDRQAMRREDSMVSTHSAPPPPQRILSHKGELASNNWRLSPGNSSGYRTLSARSDSITPSPTPNNGNPTSSDPMPQGNGVLWAITDMSSVPAGALIIHPQTGQPLTNSDGSLYMYDPDRPPTAAMFSKSQMTVEGVRVLTNPERRRSRLEKQRATLSPGTDPDSNNSDKMKSPEPTDGNQLKTDNKSSIDQTNDLQDCVEDIAVNAEIDQNNMNSYQSCLCQECLAENARAINKNIRNTTPIMDNAATSNNRNEINPQMLSREVSNNETDAVENDSSRDLKEIPGQNNAAEIITNRQNNDESLKGYSNPYNQTNGNRTDNKNGTGNGENRTKSGYEGNVNVTTGNKLGKEDTMTSRREEHYYSPNDGFEYRSEMESENQINERHILENDPIILAAKPSYDFQTGCGEPSLMSAETIKPDYCARTGDVMLYSTEVDRRQQEEASAGGGGYLVAPGYGEAQAQTFYGAVQPMQPYFEAGSTFEEQNQELQAYQGPAIALRGGCTPLQQPPLVYQQPLLQPPIQPTYALQEQEMQSYTVPPPPTAVVPPPAQHIYQVNAGGGWGWPHVALYGHHQAVQDTAHKIPAHGPFIPQQPETATIPAIPQAYYTHAPTTVLMATQPPQYYPYHHHPQILHQIQPQQNHFQVFHPFNHGRSSVLSHEGSTTPGFQTYDNQNATYNNTSHHFVNKNQEDLQKTRNTNTRSPKNVHSRGQSNSGSSRTTPLMNFQQIGNIPVSTESYGHIEQSILGAFHYSQHPMNYGILPYPPNHNECNTTANSYQFDNTIKNHVFESTGRNNSNKSYKENEQKNGYVTNDKRDMPTNERIHNKDNDSNLNQLERNMNTIQRISQTASFDSANNDSNFDKTKERRKAFRNSSLSANTLSRQDSFDHGNLETFNERPKSPVNNYNKSVDGGYQRQNNRYNNNATKSFEQNAQTKHVVNEKQQQDAAVEPDKKVTKDNNELVRYVPTTLSKEVSDRAASSTLSNDAKAFVPKVENVKLPPTSTPSVQEKVPEKITEPTPKEEVKPVINTNFKHVWNKQAIREINIKSYLNFPKNRYRHTPVGGQGYGDKTGYRQDRDRSSYVDDRDNGRRQFNKDMSSIVQSSTSSWALRSVESTTNQMSVTNSSANSSPAPIYSMSNMSKPVLHSVNQSSYSHNRGGYSKDQRTGAPHYHQHYQGGGMKRDSGHGMSGHTHISAVSDSVPKRLNEPLISEIGQQMVNNTVNQITTSNFNQKYPSRPPGTPPITPGALAAQLGHHMLAPPPTKEASLGQAAVQQQLAALEGAGLHRGQLLHSFTAGVIGMQAQPQGAFFFRQLPGWLRRAPGPSLFGSPPPMTSHIRHRAPRPHLAAPHHGQYRQR